MKPWLKDVYGYTSSLIGMSLVLLSGALTFGESNPIGVHGTAKTLTSASAAAVGFAVLVLGWRLLREEPKA